MANNMLISLVLTVFIEIILALIIGKKDKQILYAIVCMNFLTNPILVYTVNLLNVYIGQKIATICLLIFEVIVVFVEGYFLKKECSNLKKTYKFALYLNACSFAIGVLINYFYRGSFL